MMEHEAEGRPGRGFGVAGALDRVLVAELARAAEAAGYRTFWVNDTPDGDGLAALAVAAGATRTIRLGVGVIPLDRQPPERIADRVVELGIPEERLTLGVGSGGAPGGVARVETGVAALRERISASIVVGALGPRMCRLAGERADGVLLNWLTPAHARQSAAWVAKAAAAANRVPPRVDGYVRAALGGPAMERLRVEGERYAGIPAYAAHFSRMGVVPIATGAAAAEAEMIADLLAPFSAVLDETVVRAVVPEETAEAYRRLLEAAAPR